MKHILIVNPNTDTFSNPTLVSVLEALIVNGNFKISMLAPEQVIDAPKQFEGIHFVNFPVFSVTWSKKVFTWFKKWKHIKGLNRFCSAEKVTCILAVDPVGLIVAGRIKKELPKIRLNYVSFEIFFKDELLDNPYYLKIKNKEIRYSGLIDSLLVQDKEREEDLLRENHLKHKKMPVFLIPVAPNVDFKEGNNRAAWRKKLGIPEDKIVVLQSGSLEKWSGGEMLLELLKKGLPGHVILLIHTKDKLDFKNPIHQELKNFEKAGAGVMIHESSFSEYDKYLAFLQVADLALALYEKDLSSPYTGKNIEHIGLASGKFACYMSQHIPTLVNNFKSFRNIRETYDFGYLVSGIAEFRQQLVSLNLSNLKEKQKNAALVYEKILQADEIIKNYIDYLYEYN